MKKAAILAAGEGLRLKSIAPFKPIVTVNGKPLLELTLLNLQLKRFDKIALIFNDDERAMDLSILPGLKTLKIDYFFKSTPSSMHSLYEVGQRLQMLPGEHLFVSMVDSIVRPRDAEKFHLFCQSIKSDESAIMVTPFIEDEKPLTLKINAEGNVSEFQCPLEEGVLITSGVYYFSASALPLLSKMIEEGHTKMRNFLKELVIRNHKIKVYQINKTLDIDRPEDIQSAETFLQDQSDEVAG